jgi:ADP-ribose pyrophosphatase YjhB (NUDIX family)
VQHDGNGWVQCGCGHRHWGRHGAAGLFLVVDGHLLLQLRPGWAHQGGTWSIPGGARDSHESVVAAALREAQEETALDPALVRVDGVHRRQHADWRYDTVLASAAGRPDVSEHAESVELDWVPLAEMTRMSLHPAFAAALPEIALPHLRLVVDAANVIGSTPDGWWHDRVGAAWRLLEDLQGIAGAVVVHEGQDHLVTHVEMVVEGRARAMADPALDSLVRVVRAPGHGDDTIVERARTVGGVVVTSDRGLRARVADSIPVAGLRRLLA